MSHLEVEWGEKLGEDVSSQALEEEENRDTEEEKATEESSTEVLDDILGVLDGERTPTTRGSHTRQKLSLPVRADGKDGKVHIPQLDLRDDGSSEGSGVLDQRTVVEMTVETLMALVGCTEKDREATSRVQTPNDTEKAIAMDELVCKSFDREGVKCRICSKPSGLQVTRCFSCFNTFCKPCINEIADKRVSKAMASKYQNEENPSVEKLHWFKTLEGSVPECLICFISKHKGTRSAVTRMGDFEMNELYSDGPLNFAESITLKDIVQIITQTADENAATSSVNFDNASFRSEVINQFMIDGENLPEADDIAEQVSRLCELLQVKFRHSWRAHSDGEYLGELVKKYSSVVWEFVP